MSLAEGHRLGPYEVLALIGAGGMGEVYRARDTRLDRIVALKVTRAEYAADDSRRSRFEREARAISALAHPHICTLFDVGAQDGQAFLVMEHLEGQTLLERLAKGSLPLAQAVEIATQVAEALSAAHRQGIVHRDLKPSNVMLTKTGAKLLDFGLARLSAHGETPAVQVASVAATEAAPLTGRGTILGTLPYMAPEQVEGRPVDARTDIWALGLLIYEMVTGRRAFEAQGQASLIAAILEREPEPLGRRQPLAPPALERLVKRCLAKSPDDRVDTAHDVAGELRGIAEAGAEAGQGTSRRSSRLGVLGLAAFAIAGLLLGALAGRAWRLPPAPAAPVVRALLDVRPAEELTGGDDGGGGFTPGGSRTALRWTADGRALVFVGQRAGVRQIYVRELARDEARPLVGTEGARAFAVSIDDRWVAFWADGAIKRAPIAGGPAAVLLAGPVPLPRGMAWGSSGRLYFDGTDRRIWRVEPEREPEPVTTLLQGELSHSLPHVLPGERALLFTVRRRLWTWGDEEVVAQDLVSGERTVLLRDAVDARHSASGHLLFLRRGTLMAAAFDPAALRFRGEPVPVLDGIGHALTAGNGIHITGAGQVDVAASGMLAYLPGTQRPFPQGTLVAVDRAGRVTPLAAPARSYAAGISVSPDGRRLAVRVQDMREQSLWTVDIARGSLARLARGGEYAFSAWTPDGRRLVTSERTNGHMGLAWLGADVTAPAEPLAQGDHVPSSWSPDGKHLATVSKGDIWITTVTGSPTTFERLAETPEPEESPEFSPDGKWLAYGSKLTGRDEVYVRPWPGPGPARQVSVGGGENPAWNPSGGELFFLSFAGDRMRMMAVAVATRSQLVVGTPRPLFDFVDTGGYPTLAQYASHFPGRDLSTTCLPVRCYAVSPDGGRFYATRFERQPPLPPVTHVRLVQGWLDEVRARLDGEASR